MKYYIDELDKYNECEGVSNREETFQESSSTIIRENTELCNFYTFPPDDDCLTDEDSGDEGNVNMDNLPNSHLLALAMLSEIQNYPDNSSVNLERSSQRAINLWRLCIGRMRLKLNPLWL